MPRGRIVRTALASLTRHKLRTFFMALATLIGVTALTVVVAYGRGTQSAVIDNFDRMFGGSAVILMAGGGGEMGGPRSGDRATTLTLDDLEAITAAVPGVEASDPLQMVGELDVVYGGAYESIMIMGHSETHELVWNRGVSAGRYFEREEVRRSGRVAVVGEHLVTELFGGRDPVGEMVRIAGVPFEVIGVLDPMGIDPHGVDKDREIHVPITTAMRRLVNRDYITTAKIRVRESASLDGVVSRIEAVLRPRHALGPGEPDDFHMITPVQVQRTIESGNRLFTVFLPLVAGISILVGGIIVANLMLMSVNDRRAEIGLRKAVGATRRDISAQFLIESTVVTGLGGVLALGFGFVALRLVGGVSSVARHMGSEVAEAASRVPLTLPLEIGLLGIAVAIAVGLLAGVRPARRAADLDPVEALR